MNSSSPLATVGIPTYNRRNALERAVSSVLNQDYPNVELVISDNASQDTTQQFCEALARGDPRVRYIRQSRNRGIGPNIKEVLHHARGDYFMWLGDDDWLDPGYLSRCIADLRIDRAASLVCGRSVYYRGDGKAYAEKGFATTRATPHERVIEYYRHVKSNGTFYGVMRRSQVSRLPMSDANCGDWLVVASMAFIGHIRTVPEVAVHRLIGGASVATPMDVPDTGIIGFLKRNSYWFVANVAAEDVLTSPVYAELSNETRAALARRVFRIVLWRHSPGFFLSRLRHYLGFPSGMVARLKDRLLFR